MGTNAISIKICNSIDEAPNYNKIGGFKAANLTEAVIVKSGTQGGNPTVDLVFHDEQGNKFVALITGRLLKAVSQAVGNTGADIN